MRRNNVLSFFVITLFIIISGCEDDFHVRNYPRVNTLEVQEITSSGALFRAEVIYEGKDLILDHGFVWGRNKLPDLKKADRVSLGPMEPAQGFHTYITTTLAKGDTYYVCAYVITEKNTIYGREMEFKSLGSEGPAIDSINPESAAWGDTLRIFGRNFSWIKAANRVFIGETEVYNLESCSDTLLKFVVPFTIKERKNIISVNLAGNVTRYIKDTLIFLAPEIESVTPSSVFWGDTVTIKVRNLTKIPANNYVSISRGTFRIPYYFQKKAGEFKFVFPDACLSETDLIKMVLYDFPIESTTQVTLLSPKIDSISPVNGNWSTIVTLYGRFNGSATGTSVLFGDMTGTIQSITRDSVKVKVPGNLVNPSSTVTYRYGSFSAVSNQIFVLNPPVIKSITPMRGCRCQEVTIRGSNFNPGNTIVTFNTTVATCSVVTDSLIVCYVPSGLTNLVPLSVTTGERTVVANSRFYVTKASITSFEPLLAVPGDTITLYGQNMDCLSKFYIEDNHYQPAYFDCYYQSSTVAKVIMPDCSFLNGRIFGLINNDCIIYSGFELRQPEPVINSITPESCTSGAIVTITGEYFSKVPSYNRISTEYGRATVISSTSTEIKFIVPGLPLGYNEISLLVGGRGLTAPFGITITDSPWIKLTYSIGFRRLFVMDFGTERYVFSNVYNNANLWKHLGSSLSPEGNFSNSFTFSTSVAKGRKAYVISDISNCRLVEFDADTKTFREVSEYPGTRYSSLVMLDGDSVLYCGGGRNLNYTNQTYGNEFWRYHIKKNTWTRLKNLPGYTSSSNEFTIGGKCYIMTKDNRLYEYNPAGDSWTQKASSPEPWFDNRATVVCNGRAYVAYGSSSHKSISYYDPTNNSWTTLQYVVPGPREYPLAFTVNDFIFFGGGKSNNTWLTDFWRYDPSKEQ